MEKYRFVSDYTTNVSVGGVVGITQRTFKAGEIYNGLNKDGQIQIYIDSNNLIQGSSNWVVIPNNYLELYDPNSMVNTNRSTNSQSSFVKSNVLPIALIFGAAFLTYMFLKETKILK